MKICLNFSNDNIRQILITVLVRKVKNDIKQSSNQAIKDLAYNCVLVKIPVNATPRLMTEV